MKIKEEITIKELRFTIEQQAEKIEKLEKENQIFREMKVCENEFDRTRSFMTKIEVLNFRIQELKKFKYTDEDIE